MEETRCGLPGKVFFEFRYAPRRVERWNDELAQRLLREARQMVA